jgi:hypothetical protein
MFVQKSRLLLCRPEGFCYAFQYSLRMVLHGNHPVVKEDDLHLGMALLIHITRSGGGFILGQGTCPNIVPEST